MFLSRCLIYKVHALAFRPAVLFILAHSFELVKYFFQKFFNLLPKHSHSSSRSRFVELVHFTTLFRVCQELFLRFFAVFIPLSLNFKLFSEPFRVSRELAYFTTRISLCQALFSEVFRKSVQVPLGFLRPFFCFRALSQGAQIEYHSAPHLSTPFFRNFHLSETA